MDQLVMFQPPAVLRRGEIAVTRPVAKFATLSACVPGGRGEASDCTRTNLPATSFGDASTREGEETVGTTGCNHGQLPCDISDQFAPPAQRIADVGASGLTPAPTGGQAATSQTHAPEGAA